MYGKSIVTLLVFGALPLLAQKQFVFEVQASNCGAQPGGHQLTGFRVRGEPGIVTALHGVIGCKTIRVRSAYGEPLNEALTLEKFDIEADSAFLISPELSKKAADGIEFNRLLDITKTTNALVLGYPLGTSFHETQVAIRQPPVRPLFEEVPPQLLDTLSRRNSPSVKLNVLSIQGPLVPGDSGGPVIDSQGRLLGIANGGLNGGTVNQAWAIPYSAIKWTQTGLAPRLAELTENPGGLFRFQEMEEADTSPTDLNDTSCLVLAQLVKSGGNGFTDILGEVRNDRIYSTITLPNFITSIYPNRYANAFYGLYPNLNFATPPAEAMAAFYKNVRLVSNCLRGWKIEQEDHSGLGGLGTRFVNLKNFVVRVYCDDDFYVEEPKERNACGIRFYPPDPSGSLNKEIPKWTLLP